MIHHADISLLPTFTYYMKGKKNPTPHCTNIFCFDIETSSYLIRDENIYTWPDVVKMFSGIKNKRERYEKTLDFCQQSKKGNVAYLWQFGIDDMRIYGRNLDEFKAFLDRIAPIYGEVPAIIYVHNLSYEYQYLRGLFGDENIEAFFTDPRKPLYFTYKQWEFRCTYRLTNSSLAQWGKKIGIKKLDTLDYNKLYTPLSELPADALSYAERDIEIMYKGLLEYCKEYGNVWNIPYTQTGRARREVKKLYHNDINHHYKITDMQPADHNEYKTLKCVYAGGVTMAGVENAGRILKHVGSYDRASAYPYQVIAREFPSSRFRECFTSEYDFDNYHYIFYARFYNVKAKTSISCIPSSKMWHRNGTAKFNNGKLISFDGDFCMFLTEIDLQSYQTFYNFEIEYLKTWVATSSLLDIKFVNYILKLYGEKTTLKGVEGREAEYMRGKEILNSASYGMACTSLVFDETTIKDHEFITITKNDDEVDEELAKLKNSIWRNNYAFSMGIYITAYQRADLLETIRNIKPSDFCYADTDSSKMLNPENYQTYFDNLNTTIAADLEEIAAHRGIDFELFRPADKKGNKHLIGIWENEGVYDEAIFLGAKRYMYIQDGHKAITVAGVPKVAAEHIEITDFKDGLIFDQHDMEGKKNVLCYLDGDNPEVILNKGHPDEWKVQQPYSICMYPIGYDMSLTKEYSNLIDMYNNRKGIII